MKKRTFWLFVCVVLLVLPRTPAAYALYFLGTILLFELNIRVLVLAALTCLASFLVFTFTRVIGYQVSPTSWLLAFVMHLPLFLIIGGCSVDTKRIDPLAMLRMLNLAVFVLSIFSMVVNRGFPAYLPYIHYLPDEYFALFGLGGAKIVTVIGFFTLTSELFLNKRNGSINKVHFLIACSNFLVPSYLIATVCGIFALALPNIKRPAFQVLLGFVTLALLDFILNRVNNINSGLADLYGYHPKILAYIAVFKLYLNEPTTIFLGTGIGQFASTAAEWGSEYLTVVGRSIKMPGLFMSYFHDEYLGLYLVEGLVNKWTISSSMNKPYTTFSVMLAEFGFVLAVLAIGRLILLMRRSIQNKAELITITVFVLSLFFMEVWHDNFWFSACLALYLAKEKAENSKVILS
jgi:uncharacterized membrane protein